MTKRIVHFTLITLDLYLAVTTLLCFYFLALALRNRKTLRMFTYAPDLRRTPRVSIIIPARNEENNIRACLDSLIAQEYPDYEILVIDDNSSDATYKIIKQYESSHSIIRAFRGKPLPPDWVGKQYACQQLIPEASGEYLVFTDADTVHTPLSLSWAVTNMVNHDADFMSAYLHHVIGSLGEAFVVPAIYIMTTLLMPLWKIPEKNNSFFTFAIGQFMICRREALLAVGGYNSFKNSVVEDMSMAHAMKERGYKTIFIDGKNYVSCRMYRSFRGAFRGFAKSMYGALHQNLLLLLGLFIIVGAVIEMPVLILCHKLYSGSDDILLSILPVSTFCGLWFIVLLDRKISVIVALSYPILFLVVMLIALTSTLKTGFLQGVEWKGRKVRCHRGLEEQKKETLQEPRRINGKNIYPITTLYAKIVFWITLALVILFDLIVYHMRIRGRKNLKTVKNGGFLVSNHSLYLDPGIIAHAIAPRRTFFTAMAPMFDIPFIGHYIRMLGAFPVSETMPLRSLVRVVRSIMDQKKLVHVFPEGDLSHLSREIAPFRDGIFFLAILLDKPILPVVIKTIGQKNPLKIFFKYRIEVTILPPIYPAMFKSEGNDTAAVLREISRHAWTEMTSVMQ